MKACNWTAKSRRCEMHACLRNVMRLSRWAGFFPVEGLDKSSSTTLKLKVNTVYSIYCVATLTGQIVASGFSLYVLFIQPINLSNISTFLFYITGLTSSIFLLRLAQFWPSLMNKAASLENRLIDIQINKNVELKTNIMAYTIVFMGAVEHSLCIAFNFKTTMSCLEETNVTLDVFKNVLLLRLSFVFDYMSFNMWKGVFLKVVDIQSVFLWSFLDVMISCVSIYITEYFKELNKIINSPKDKTAKLWEQIRLNYSNLVALVKEVENHTSHCVLLCLFTDLFFICVHLFNALNKNTSSNLDNCEEHLFLKALHSLEHMYYYSFSFVFLLTRVLILSLSTANVNSVAQEPIVALGEVPASVFNISIQRFYRQINYNTVAISGLFFKVTRRMILKVIGTIITYELVLLQFHRGSKSIDYNHVNNVTHVLNKTSLIYICILL